MSSILTYLRTFVLGVCLPGSMIAAAAPPPPVPPANVLVVLSYHVGMEWEDGVLAGVRDALGGEAELVLLQLDVKRFAPLGREEAMRTNLASKASMCRPSAVITVDDYAFEFVRRHRDMLPSDVPHVVGGVNFVGRTVLEGVGVVEESIDIGGTLDLMAALRPGMRRLVVVNDSTETGQTNDRTLVAALDAMQARWSVLRLGRGSFEETEAALAGLDPERDGVLLLSWNLDANGQTRSYDEAIARARALCPAPLFGVWSFYLGHGIVGGALLDGREHGRALGNLTRLALAGQAPSRLSNVLRCPSALQVDVRELGRFGIALRRLPPGVERRFETVPFWREHAGKVTLAATIVLLQTATIMGLMASRRRRIRAELELRANQADLRNVLDSIGDAVVVTDADSRILQVNPVAVRLMGADGAAAEGRAVGDLLRLTATAGDGSPVDPVAQVLAASPDAPPVVGRAELVVGGGDARAIDFIASAVQLGAGARRKVVLALRDVTAQQRTEAQLRQAQKMEAVGRLVGGVAHDFNNLLLVIRGSLELARTPGTDQAEIDSYLHEVDEAARRAAELTQQLLAFGRQQKLQMRPTDLGVLLAGMLKLVRRVLGEGIRLEMRGPVSNCWANIDPGQIEQVIMNLCVNARDAMPGGGEIMFEIGRASFAAANLVAYPWTRPGTYHVLTVTDSGTGMDAETLRRVFEPFFTTKAVGRGTGLGLSVVQGIVQQHDGLINVYSEVGKGTTFRIYLPVIGSAAGAPTAPSVTVVPAAVDEGVGITLLLAEDDPAVRRIAANGLRAHGYRVLEVSDGEAACAVAAAHVGPISVAVLDVVMPRLGGPEAARRLQAARPGLPILLCSGYPGTMPNETEMPADWKWLAKPYPIADLLAQVRQLRTG